MWSGKLSLGLGPRSLGTQVAKATTLTCRYVVALAPAPSRRQFPHAAPPPGVPRSLPLTGRLCLTILTPSAEPMAAKGLLESHDAGSRTDQSQSREGGAELLQAKPMAANRPATEPANHSAEKAGREPLQANNSRRRRPQPLGSRSDPGLSRSRSTAPARILVTVSLRHCAIVQVREPEERPVSEEGEARGLRSYAPPD